MACSAAASTASSAPRRASHGCASAGSTSRFPIRAVRYGSKRGGEALDLAVLGDSAAAGYGAHNPKETYGAFLAAGLSLLADRPVRLRCVATVGARTSDLDGQIDLVTDPPPVVSALIIGANDVTHRVRPADSVRRLGSAVERLRDLGSAVVVGTCPDLGTVRPIAPPLRQVARGWSRRLAAAQTIATVEAGGRSVSLGSLLGAEFAAAPLELFGPDRFHPSPEGFRRVAAAMLPTVAAAAGVFSVDDVDLHADRGDVMFSLPRAAVEAGRQPGVEVARTERPGRGAGVRGRWVTLRLRRREPMPMEGPDTFASGVDRAVDSVPEEIG